MPPLVAAQPAPYVVPSSDDTGTTRPGSGVLITDIAIDGTNVYWTVSGASGGVFLKPFSGGAQVTVSGNEGDPIGIAVDQTYVYWADFLNGGVFSKSIYEASMNIGSVNVLVSPPDASSPGPSAIARDANNVYWVDRTEGSVYQRALSGGSPMQIASGQTAPIAIALDGG